MKLDDPSIVTNYVHPHSKNAGLPAEKVLPPKVGGEFSVDDNVIAGMIERCMCLISVTDLLLSSANPRNEVFDSLPLWLVHVGSDCEDGHGDSWWIQKILYAKSELCFQFIGRISDLNLRSYRTRTQADICSKENTNQQRQCMPLFHLSSP